MICERKGKSFKAFYTWNCCPKAHNLFNSFFQWWNRMRDLEIPADYDFLKECIIFGFHLRGEIFEVLNFCILNGKYYMHNKRLLDDNNIEFLHFLYVLKFKLYIEHKICKMNNTTQTFNKFVFLYDQMWYQHILFMK